jgi:hypothetical protein
LAAIIKGFGCILFPEVIVMTPWEKFCATGKIDDYLAYCRDTDKEERSCIL